MKSHSGGHQNRLNHFGKVYLPSFLTMTNSYRSVIFQNLYPITAKKDRIFLINLNLIMNKIYLKYF